MDYYAALAEAMDEAEKNSFLPLDLTYQQITCRIEEITEYLKKSGVRNDERILLHAERHGLRIRLRRAVQVAERLGGWKDGKQKEAGRET